MAERDEVAGWIHALAGFRTRAHARRQLEQCGPAAAEQVLPLLTDDSLPENMRWAAIMVVKTWGYAPAAPLLLQVLRTQTGLRGAALQALETLTGLAIGDAPDEWEKALADPEAYRREHDEPQAQALAESSAEPDGCRLFRQAVGDVASEITWEDDAYLYLRIPLAGGRKQQIVVTFNEVDAGGRPLTTIYTECGQLQSETPDSLARRNVTARYGKFCTQKNAEGNEIVVMREAVPAQRLTPKLARDIVLAIAAEADSLEFEMTGSDHI